MYYFNTDGYINNSVVSQYKHDKNGDRTEMTNYAKDGKFTFVWTNTYHDKRLKTEECVFGANGEPATGLSFEVDNKKFRVDKIEYKYVEDGKTLAKKAVIMSVAKKETKNSFWRGRAV